MDYLRAAWGGRNPKWRDSTFEIAKFLSTTEKGNAVEDFAVQLLKQTGHPDAQRHHSRRGDWDVRVGDTKYDLLLVIGIAPEAVLFNLYPKKRLLDFNLVSMSKGANATFKLTRAEKDLRPIAEFGKVFGDLIA